MAPPFVGSVVAASRPLPLVLESNLSFRVQAMLIRRTVFVGWSTNGRLSQNGISESGMPANASSPLGLVRIFEILSE